MSRPRRGRAVILLACALGLTAWSAAGRAQDRVAPQTGGSRLFWPQRPAPVPPIVTQVPAAQAPAAAANQVIVQFRPEATEAARDAVRAAVGATASRPLRAPDGRLELVTISLPVPDAVRILAALPQVEFAEPDWIVRAESAPNDTYYTDGSLWGMYGDSTTPANPFGSQAGELWERGITGSATTYVGVIDSGIDVNHPELAPNVWTNPFDPVDGVDNDGNGYVDDVHGWDFWNRDNSVYDGDASTPQVDAHGTHVAGTIGARGGDAAGVAGVSWNVTLVPMKFLGPSFGFTSDAVLAVNYMIDLKTRHGLDVVAVNNSWDGSSYSTALHQAIIRAAKAGILFVAAAGNTAQNNDTAAKYPANYSTTQSAGSETAADYEAVISVAAIGSAGELASFSNYGAAAVDIGAPGVGIYSTIPQGTYAVWNGTSMAAPHVSGAVALFRALAPTASAGAIRSALLSAATPTASLSGRTATGGRLNLGDFAVSTHNFTDSPLIPGLHPIRAIHVTELRDRVNLLRERHGLVPVAWTDPVLGPSVFVKAAHFTELRSALDAVYHALGRTPPAHTDPTLWSASTFVRAAHVSDLRSAVEALEP